MVIPPRKKKVKKNSNIKKQWNAQRDFICLYHMEAWWGLDTAGGKLLGSPSCRTSPARLPPRSRSRSTRVCVCPPAAASASWASAWHSWPSPPSPSRPRSAAKTSQGSQSQVTANLGQTISELCHSWFEEVLTVGCTPRKPEQLSAPQLQDVLLLPTQWRL